MSEHRTDHGLGASPRPAERRWLVDLGLTVIVLAAVEITIVTGGEQQSIDRDWLAYVLGVAMAVPVLFHRRYPVAALYAVAVFLFAFYAIGYPGFPPSVVLGVPLYFAVEAGYPWRALPVPVFFMAAGAVVILRDGIHVLALISYLMPHLALLTVAILLGALVRSRRAYAAEVRGRLRRAEEEREREAERRVAQERLRIARELHDTVAHAVATITVQSGTALHVLDRQPERAREALTAIRQTAKAALGEMRATLGVLRQADEEADGPAGLERLPDLLVAVRAAGLEVTVDSGQSTVDTAGLAAPVDHAAYRILQESLTNVLRHAGPHARAYLSLRLEPDAVAIEVADDGFGGNGNAPGHGLAGMRERAEALGGQFTAGPRPGGGYAVTARLPREAATLPPGVGA
jgi:signal transduction histidine kinase